MRRCARLIELEPQYVDVIVRRWQEFTGKSAILEGHGGTFAEVANERLRKAA
jgi:DNA modification methylase